MEAGTGDEAMTGCGFAKLLRVAAMLAVMFGSANLRAEDQAGPPLRVAAAADLEPVLPALLAQFQAKTGIRAEASYQSSGTLAAQILNGAPFDLFLAADLSFPQKVADGGLTITSRPIPYAQGTLALWARRDSRFFPPSLAALRDPSLRRLAVAHPEHAPYGRAAIASLTRLELIEELRGRLVLGENIAQTAQFAESGNAEMALLSLTLCLTPRLAGEGGFVRMPADSYPPIVQGAVVIKRAAHAQAARQLLDFLLSPAVQQQMAAHGLEPAPRDFR